MQLPVPYCNHLQKIPSAGYPFAWSHLQDIPLHVSHFGDTLDPLESSKTRLLRIISSCMLQNVTLICICIVNWILICQFVAMPRYACQVFARPMFSSPPSITQTPMCARLLTRYWSAMIYHEDRPLWFHLSHVIALPFITEHVEIKYGYLKICKPII